MPRLKRLNRGEQALPRLEQLNRGEKARDVLRRGRRPETKWSEGAADQRRAMHGEAHARKVTFRVRLR